MPDRSRQNIRVSVKPDSRREHVAEKGNDSFTVSVKESARGGRANRRVREILAMRFAVPVKQVVVTTGGRSRVKLVTIYGNK